MQACMHIHSCKARYLLALTGIEEQGVERLCAFRNEHGDAEFGLGWVAHERRAFNGALVCCHGQRRLPSLRHLTPAAIMHR